MNTDIAVIGGGASGLAAAIAAKTAAPDADVVILEKLPRVGKKIIASGNGKCNLSNEDLSEYRYHGSVDAMKVIREEIDCRTFFTDELGILLVTGSESRTGGIYPRSNSSTTVLNALRLRIQALGVHEICETEVLEIIPEKSGFTLRTNNSSVHCRRVIAAAGGYAAPAFGTDGGLMRVLRDMGYKTAKVCPAAAPLRVSPESVKGLKGVRVKGEISAVSGGKTLRTEKGEIQFNDNNISGICVFNLAYLFAQYEGKLNLRADLMSDMTAEELTAYLKAIQTSRSELSLEELLTGVFVRNLALYITRKSLARPLTELIGTLSDGEIKKIVRTVKSLEFTVTGCSSWQNAQSTMGGIHADCIGSDMQSKLHKGLYLCGELLDAAGDCGGYNLQWAWSSGLRAGRCCGESL